MEEWKNGLETIMIHLFYPLFHHSNIPSFHYEGGSNGLDGGLPSLEREDVPDDET